MRGWMIGLVGCGGAPDVDYAVLLVDEVCFHGEVCSGAAPSWFDATACEADAGQRLPPAGCAFDEGVAVDCLDQIDAAPMDCAVIEEILLGVCATVWTCTPSTGDDTFR